MFTEIFYLYFCQTESLAGCAPWWRASPRMPLDSRTRSMGEGRNSQFRGASEASDEKLEKASGAPLIIYVNKIRNRRSVHSRRSLRSLLEIGTFLTFTGPTSWTLGRASWAKGASPGSMRRRREKSTAKRRERSERSARERILSACAVLLEQGSGVCRSGSGSTAGRFRSSKGVEEPQLYAIE